MHVVWALAAGGRLGVGNDPRYNKTRCFEPYPFPNCTEEQTASIRALAEQLDAHRKRQQALHPRLTLTGMYNVLERLRAEEPLSEAERQIHEQGLVTVLRRLHDDLDAAVFAAYGWDPTHTDAEILERLVALNAERVREERAGLVRWLRPEFQNPAGAGQAALDTGEGAVAALAAARSRLPWPAALPDQFQAVRAALAQAGVSTPQALAASFLRGRADRIEGHLRLLVTLGHARELEPGRFSA